MGFPIEFNHLIVLKDKAAADFVQAASENARGASLELVVFKDGARLYPMGYEIPVAIGHKDNLVGSARIIQQGIDDLEDGFRTRIRLGNIRGAIAH